MPNIQVTDCLHQQLLSDQLVQGTVGLQHFGLLECATVQRQNDITSLEINKFWCCFSEKRKAKTHDPVPICDSRR